MKSFLCTLLFALTMIPLGAQAQVKVGADQIDDILTHTHGQKVGMVVNHTSTLSSPTHEHIVDVLIAKGVNVVRLFSPEHGLRGTADAGAKIESGKDSKTGLPVISLYGKHRKPTSEDLSGLDLIIFDLQDVGVRFYTYISTLTMVMESCAEQGVAVLVLDRPNPRDYVDGAVRVDPKYKSFVSLLPIPAVHGLTLGEAALMINGEGWLSNGVKADLSIIPIVGWNHGDQYLLPIPPSPNLRSKEAIFYYPTTCYFEGTSWSEGRGTEAPFEQVGFPNEKLGSHSFTPKTMAGAGSPKHEGKRCYGPDFKVYKWTKEINLDLIIDAYNVSKANGVDFFTRESFFDLLAGNSTLRQQIIDGLSADEIRQSWQKDLKEYKALRAKYLIYPDAKGYYCPCVR